jgi:ABC-2 type transport system ATP-binding protein
MAILETKALTRRYGDLVAVDELQIAVDEGEVFGLLGPNGAGKTTALKMLTTLLPPTSGSATIAGFDVVRKSAEVRRVIGYVPQALSADGTLTGYENLAVFARLYDLPRTDRDRRIHEALDFMGLDEVAGRMVRTYSGGMIRRLEIAQSVLHHPRVLFLDEPTVGLDPLARQAVWDYLGRLCCDFDMTVILTTHYMEEADHLCQRVAIMHEGKTAVVGSPADLKASISNGHGEASLDEVFAHYTGGSLESGGSYRETSRARRVAKRLG